MMTCPCRFIDFTRRILLEDAEMGKPVHVQGQGYVGNLSLPLNFVVKLTLL